MFNTIRKLFKKPEPVTEAELLEMEQIGQNDRLFHKVVMENTCPDCGGIGFLTGPPGGMSTNIFCKSEKCRSGFNVTPFGGGKGLCDRISKGNSDYYLKEEEI